MLPGRRVAREVTGEGEELFLNALRQGRLSRVVRLSGVPVGPAPAARSPPSRARKASDQRPGARLPVSDGAIPATDS